jgi:hypothetical protein
MMDLQGKATRGAAVTEESPQEARPRANDHRDGDSLSSTCDADQPAHKRARGKHGVRTGHGITAHEKTSNIPMGEQTMEEEAVFTEGEYDFTAAHRFGRAGGNLGNVAGPECGQHAFAANLQAQAAGAAQSFHC